jgi:hypothetical protein
LQIAQQHQETKNTLIHHLFEFILLMRTLILTKMDLENAEGCGQQQQQEQQQYVQTYSTSTEQPVIAVTPTPISPDVIENCQQTHMSVNSADCDAYDELIDIECQDKTVRIPRCILEKSYLVKQFLASGPFNRWWKWDSVFGGLRHVNSHIFMYMMTCVAAVPREARIDNASAARLWQRFFPETTMHDTAQIFMQGMHLDYSALIALATFRILAVVATMDDDQRALYQIVTGDSMFLPRLREVLTDAGVDP